MRTLTAALILSLIITSCSKSDTAGHNPSATKLDSVQIKYLFTHETHVSGSVLNATPVFQYTNNQVVKRAGAYVSYLLNDHFITEYMTSLYDTVLYHSADSLTMMQKCSDPRFYVNPVKRTITLENGLLKKKITYAIKADLPNDTMYYYYDDSKRIQRTEQYFLHDYVVKTYFFDASGNLARISSIRKGRITGAATITEEEEFGGYDSKPNPLKGQYILWDDTFLRSLSANNFTTHKYTKTELWNGTPPMVEQLTWTLVYDSNGNVDFTK